MFIRMAMVSTTRLALLICITCGMHSCGYSSYTVAPASQVCQLSMHNVVAFTALG